MVGSVLTTDELLAEDEEFVATVEADAPAAVLADEELLEEDEELLGVDVEEDTTAAQEGVEDVLAFVRKVSSCC